jgi:hypothetical protein
MKILYYFYRAFFTIHKNIGCKVNVHYEPPEDGLVRAETCVGVEG